MKAVLDGAVQISKGVFDVRLSPTDALRLGGNPLTLGSRSVILAEEGKFDSKHGTLTTELSSLRPLAIGTGDRAIVLLDEGHVGQGSHPPYSANDAAFDARHYPGDREFLEEVSALPSDVEIAVRRLLGRVRSRSPGSMKRGSRRNFSNQPDNFWYAVVQPVKGNVSITVRGRPENFQPSTLDLKMDRPGYTRFYLSDSSQVEEAYRIVSASKRRK